VTDVTWWIKNHGRDLGRHRPGPGVITMENDMLITAIFLGAGPLAYVVIPGLLIMWDRVPDHMGSTGEGVQKGE
jgi:hypothetical protein